MKSLGWKLDYKQLRLYLKYTIVCPELLAEFHKLLLDKRKHRIKISRNAAKAEKMKKRLRKYFYIQK